jgi:hypothetical protein
VLDIEADHVAIAVEVDDEALDDLPRLGPGSALQLDVEAVGSG